MELRYMTTRESVPFPMRLIIRLSPMDDVMYYRDMTKFATE